MQGRGTASVVGGLVIFGAVLGLRFMNKSEAGDQVRHEVRLIVSHADGYNDNRAYFDYLVDAAHEKAFSDSYHMAVSRRDRSSFDDDQYMLEVFPLMIEQATADGSTHIAEALKKLQKDWEDHPEKFEPKKK